MMLQERSPAQMLALSMRTAPTRPHLPDGGDPSRSAMLRPRF
ncbi:MAG: hypothetical protein RLP09_43215 [Sandaracinaceae bacterium]